MKKKFFAKLKNNLIKGTMPTEKYFYGSYGIITFLEMDDLLTLLKVNKILSSIVESVFHKRKGLELMKLDSYYLALQENEIIKRKERENFINTLDNEKVNNLSQKFKNCFFSESINNEEHLSELTEIFLLGGSANIFIMEEFSDENLCDYLTEVEKYPPKTTNYDHEFKKIKIAIDSDLDKNHLFFQKTYAGMGGMPFLYYVTLLIFTNYFSYSKNNENGNIEMHRIAFKIFESLYILDVSDVLNLILLKNYKISNDIDSINLQKKFFKMIILLLRKQNYHNKIDSYILDLFYKTSFLIFAKYENTFIPLFLEEIIKIDPSLLKGIFNHLPDRVLLRNLIKTKFIKEYIISSFKKELNFLLFDLLHIKEYNTLKLLINYDIKINGNSKLLEIKNPQGRNLYEELLNHRGVKNKFLQFLISKMDESKRSSI